MIIMPLWFGVGDEDDVHSMMPKLRDTLRQYNDRKPSEATSGSSPGFLAPQSAQRLFPGTLCTRSWRTFSLRACWRLLRALVILKVEAAEHVCGDDRKRRT
jgi:hypothetical protein